MIPAPIYWSLLERSRVELDHGSPWLSPAEHAVLAGFRFPKRRDEWLLGRYAAKALLRSLPEYRALPPQAVEVRNDPQGAPGFVLPDGLAPTGCLSLSHSGPYALAALVRLPDLRPGADLEKVEPRSEAFVEDYLTPCEREMVHAAPPEERAFVATLVWSMKEAMLKALGVGLRLDTRRVEVAETDQLPAAGDGWQALSVSDHEDPRRRWVAWARRHEAYVLTAAVPLRAGLDPGALELVEQSIG